MIRNHMKKIKTYDKNSDNNGDNKNNNDKNNDDNGDNKNNDDKNNDDNKNNNGLNNDDNDMIKIMMIKNQIKVNLKIVIEKPHIVN